MATESRSQLIDATGVGQTLGDKRNERSLRMEIGGFEPPTSAMRTQRSPN